MIVLFFSLIPLGPFTLLFSLVSSFLSLALQRIQDGTWGEGGTHASDNPVELLLQSIIQEHNITTLDELLATVTNNVAFVEGTKQYTALAGHVKGQILYQVNLVQTVVPWIVTLIMAGSIITCCTPASLEDENILHPQRRLRKRLVDDNLIPFVPHPKSVPDTTDLCSICWEPLHGAPQTQSATCRHHFHRTCVAAWLMHGTKCPSCRQPYLNRRTTTRLERMDSTDP